MMRPRVSIDWTQIRWRVAIVVLVMAVVVVALSDTQSEDRRAAAICAQRYHAALTSADTARIDADWPGGGNPRARNGAATLRCGALRAVGKIPR